jgi:hypothetical protein
MTVWVGVGGSPESVVRVVRQDLQLMLAIIGGDSARFAPYIDLYHRACAQLGRPVRPVGVHSPGFVAETDEIARKSSGPITPTCSAASGVNAAGPRSPGQVSGRSPARRALCRLARDGGAEDRKDRAALGIQRFDMKYSTGPMPHADLMTCIRLYGEKVIPMVQDMLAEKQRRVRYSAPPPRCCVPRFAASNIWRCARETAPGPFVNIRSHRPGSRRPPHSPDAA